MSLRTFSFGGGVQSVAVLVLAAQKKLHYDTFLFANVGNDSENPGTLTYLKETALPFALEHGIDLLELKRTWRDGRQVTLYEYVVGDIRSIPIPVYMDGGGVGRRKCTDEWKRNTIARWQRKHGATPENPAICGLGISTDEIHRVRSHSNIPYQVLEYPLIDLGLSRADCVALIKDAGLPVPPKSSCWFCPFHKKAEWQEMARTDPDLFAQALALEERINEKRAEMGKDHVFLHTSKKPLPVAVTVQEKLFEDDFCESGYCMV